VSVEAISWALNLAPVPADHGGRPSSTCKFVLVGLANHAGPDGAGAFPSVATLVRYTGLSERTVRTCLDRLEAEGIIAPCDPDVVAARIKRADRRPLGWNLNLSLVHDLADKLGAAAPEGQLSARQSLPTERLRRVYEGHSGAQPSHLAANPVDKSTGGVQPTRPAAGTRCNQRGDGVQPVQRRGAAVAPEPYVEPSLEPSAAHARAPDPTPTDARSDRGGGVAEFFAALGDQWPLTAAQQSRLVPALMSALTGGWTPLALAGWAAANTGGVRSPYAVLASRLSPAELPEPKRQRPTRLPWCGYCDEVTRMLGFDGDAPRPCPRCKPTLRRTKFDLNGAAAWDLPRCAAESIKSASVMGI